MDDLISRKAAIDSIKDPVVKGFAMHGLKNVPSVPAVPLEELLEWLTNWMANMRELMSNQPTVDATPVKHGHWEDVGSLSCRCSECGCKNDRETRFCPNCGAKMDFLYDLRGQNGFGGIE